MSDAEHSIQLRPALLQDAKLIFGWRNNPFLVARSSSQRTVEWNEHIRWFQSVLASPGHRIYIILLDDLPIGQIRFDETTARRCVISVYVLEQFTGKGFGVAAIQKGCREIFRSEDVDVVIACVRQDNSAAQQAFLRCGFAKSGEDLCPAEHITFVLKRAVIESPARTGR